MQNFPLYCQTACSVIQRCQALGVCFAIDDFGTGYSSLTYLRRLSAETLKIDQSFIIGMINDKDRLAIIKGIVGLASAFGRKVIAEGVETVCEGEKLIELGCEQAQGFAIAKAMSPELVAEWLTHWRSHSVWQRASDKTK